MTIEILKTPKASRRAFLAGAGGLVVAVALPMKARAQLGAATSGAATFVQNVFIRVGADDIVTVAVQHIEFGQGPFTGLATLVAEELDADWSQMRAEHAPVKAEGEAGGMTGTGGSGSMAGSFQLMREAGATARAMLLAAAAASWGVPASELTISKGVISHPSGKTGRFGEFAEAAATMTPPENPVLKKPEDFVYIGKQTPKLDTAAKTTGAAIYTLDLYKEGMLTAVVAHAPRFGATVASFDDAAARAVPGVVDVKKIGGGVAVYGRNSFAALKGRKALNVNWATDGAETRSTRAIAEEMMQKVSATGAVANNVGDVDAFFADNATVHEAQYHFPYLAHAPMEPLDAVVARAEDGKIDCWLGSQFPGWDGPAMAEVCGVAPEDVRMQVMIAGGSFGRRAQGSAHLAREAGEVFMAAGGQTPVKLMWTREDDIQGGYYRPMSAHRLRGALDADGNIAGWEHICAGQSILKGTPFEGAIQNGVDFSMVEGAREIPYSLPNFRMSAHIVDNPVTTLWWRSVGHTHTGYVVETFIDELLEKAGKDAVAGRVALMDDAQSRLRAVLQKAAEIADWGRQLPAGRALGVAAVKSFNSYVAQIAEVSEEDGMPKVHKVWCAVDCGIAVNPEVVRAQMEGGIGYGLSAILHEEITFDDTGAIENSNFHDYTLLRMGQMPAVEVFIMPSDAPPTGVGEPGLPPIGPAVANAFRRLTGKPSHVLPMTKNLEA